MLKNQLKNIIVLIIFSSQLFASGFQINEHGAKSMAMAGAFTGLANDASAVHFNPAGITQLFGTNLMMGATLISPKASFRGVSPAITEYKVNDQQFTPINFYFTHQLSNNLTFGFGVNNPYGLGTSWDENWVGKYLAIDTDLKTFVFNPVIAVKVDDKLSVAFGLNYGYGEVTIKRAASLAPFTGDALVTLKGNGTSLGFTAGILYKPLPYLSLGASFKSEAKYTLEGDAVSEGPSAFAAALPSGNISADLSTPMNLSLGLAYHVNSYLVVTADYQFVGWSSYRVLAVDFENPAITDLSAERNYTDSYILRFGGELSLSKSFDFRFGMLIDQNPVPSEFVEPTLPDSDRMGFNAGVGYSITENLKIDLSYMFIRFYERTISNSKVHYTDGNSGFNGTYNASANLFAADFSYNF